MNKYQEALDKLSSWSKRWANTRLHGDDYINDLHNGIDCEKDTLQKLVDKATPMKANDEDYECPKCHHGFENYEGLRDETLVNDFCQFCGQALDWSKDE